MKIQFNIHYYTNPGQYICIYGSLKSFGSWETSKAIKLEYISNGHWSVTLDVRKNTKLLEYKYLLLEEDGTYKSEWGAARKMELGSLKTPMIYAMDYWKAAGKEEKVLHSSAFSKVIMKPNFKAKGKLSKAKKRLQFKIEVPRIAENYQICILGNQAELGNWDESNPLLMNCKDFPVWTASINMAKLEYPVKYKYGIYDSVKGELISLEAGIDRYVHVPPAEGEEYLYSCFDFSYRHKKELWRGAGVSVPVFSLRSENSLGVGEFNDLIEFINWAKSVGLKMVQILPINETIAFHNWLDSYPYKSISVTALHPIYLNLEKTGKIRDKKLLEEYAVLRSQLNEKEHVDYPEVMRLKSRYYKLLFDQEKDTFFDSKSYKSFYFANKDWLVPYAAYAYLRDKMKSPDFRTWGKYSKFDKKEIQRLCRRGSKQWEDIAIHFFIQFHLDNQLAEVTEHAREQGVVLKGDIPIGISPNSVEAWMEPHLFNLNAQAGAPPDDFAIKGQNWGFPTYNWKAMAEEAYSWWMNRLQKMGTYFDAYRIDHILGFFRIWEIPTHAVEGVLGYFNPAIPMTSDEIAEYHFGFDANRMAEPFIRYQYIRELFGNDTETVIDNYLECTGPYSFVLKDEFNTQIKLNQHFLNNITEEELSDADRRIRDGLFNLIANVLFIKTGDDEWHPRVMLYLTNSFKSLDEYSQHQLMILYNHYFYQRHNDFWYQQGMDKLPHILRASDMLVCGEDLGMVPACVPPVMDLLNILTLEIQRMPKDPNYQFAHPANAPYLSICTTSTHDMPTIRGWWEENPEETQRFYNQELKNLGTAPSFAEPWICRQIIQQHLESPAMWTTFPIQDLMAIDGNLRWKKTHEEQINQPSNVRHKWRYRMKQSLEELKQAQAFNKLLRSMVKASGRDSDM